MTLDLERVVEALPAYDVGGELGRGGWGLVLSGRHRQLGRAVAIKELPRAFAADASVRARFATEARVLASLDHPHIVPVYDYIESEGLCLLVMEHLPGGTVWSRFTGTGMTVDAAAGIVLATCAALEWAHRQGVLHRDVKPENLMFSATGILKVTDFGIAKVLGGSDTLATRKGEVLGTPAYMAPEQAQGTDLTPATDVYAAGVMLYELLSGRLPFPEDGDAMAVLYRHVHEQPTPLGEVAPGVPDAVADVVMRALATDPAERWDSAEAFGVALAEACTAAWGVGWLGRGGMRVMADDAIVAATERPSGVPAATTPASAQAAAPAPPTELVAPPPATAAPAAPTELVAPPPATAAPPPLVVRPTITVHAGVVVIPASEDIRPDLVPVSEVLASAPLRPGRPLVAALALAVVTLGIAFLGLGAPGHGGTIPRGTVRVAGVDAASGTPVHLDLSKPFSVAGTSAVPGRVVVRFSALGIPLGSGSARISPRHAGAATSSAAGTRRFVVSVDASGARYLAVGLVTGEVILPNGATHRFPVVPTGSAWLSVPGAVGIALVLFVIAYAESLLRSLRRGRKRITGTVDMVGVGVLFGVAAVWLAWLSGISQPLITTTAVCAVLGAGAGLATAGTARAAYLSGGRWRARSAATPAGRVGTSRMGAASRG